MSLKNEDQDEEDIVMPYLHDKAQNFEYQPIIFVESKTLFFKILPPLYLNMLEQ